MKNGNKNRVELPPADMEPNPCNEASRANEIKKIDAPACVHVHCRRHVLCDSDGLCAKWVLDAIVSCGILQDDSAKYVKAVTFSQEKIKRAEQETTTVTIKT